MSSAPAQLQMTDTQFRMFCDLLRDHCGLHFDADSRFLVEKRLARRVEALGLTSFASYLYELRRGAHADEEMSRVIDDLTTNETYFFREMSQLRALIHEIIPEIRLRRETRGSEAPVNIWSAGCSSGEEPFTIVMLALEAGLVPGTDLRVYASDISSAMLTKARRGVYRPASFRETDPVLRDKYFVEKEGSFRISDDIKRHVDFIHLNLMDPSKISLLGSMDVVICRNVIIYFDAETKRHVIQTFHDRLRPGGYLLLGHSESLINLSSAFELCHLKNDLVYRRPMPGEETGRAWHRIAENAIRDVEEGGAS